MPKIFSIFFIFLFMMFSSAFASYNSKISFMAGAESVSVTESESGLVQTDESVASEEEAAESASVMSMNVRADYSFFSRRKWEAFSFLSLPAMSSSTGSLWSGGVGGNYYLLGASSKFNFSSKLALFNMSSLYGFYVGGHGAAGYIVYQTVSEKSADFAFSLGAHAGGYYKVSKNWSLKGELGLSRWIGSMTSSMGMKIYAGVETAI